MKVYFRSLMVLAAISAAPLSASVLVTSPANGATTGSSVQYAASANTTTCSLGVASMGIYIDDSLKYVALGSSLNTNLQVSPGTHKSVVQAWDFCGGATSAVMGLTVNNTQTGVSVTSPANNSTVGSPAAYVASATSGCSRGVAGMGIYVNDQLVYATQGANLNTLISMGAGNQKTVVQEWDLCGGSTSTPVNVTVTGTTLSNLQSAGGWNQWGELAPVYDICSGSCPGVNWSMNQHISSNSLSGNATQFNIGGTTPYSDVLWSNPVIGQGSTQNMPDNNHTLLPTVHHLTYDTYVYVTNFSITQDLEFDINMFMNGVGMEWGTECNHLASGAWDIWNNVEAKWVPTNIPCSLNDNAWNHVVLQVEREPNNDLLYQTITVNGVTSTINQTVAPFQVPSGWYGMTVNYQMDGNYRQASNTTYLDKLNVTYW